MLKQFGLLLGVLVLVIFLAYWSSKPGNLDALFSKTPNIGTSLTGQSLVTVGTTQFKVDVVNTEQARRVGLSGKESLPEDSGMLFVFESQDTKPVFWMKDMKFAIDMVWINDNKVAEITSDVTPAAANTPTEQLTRYSPKTNIDYVLEIPAGVAAKHGIKVGDEVKLPDNLQAK